MYRTPAGKPTREANTRPGAASYESADAEKLALLTRTVEHLTSRGYEYIGMDHFAVPEDDLVKARQDGSLHRNFQGYSTHAELDLVGLGVSAIGKIGHSYAQSIKLRHDYYDAIDAGRIPAWN